MRAFEFLFEDLSPNVKTLLTNRFYQENKESKKPLSKQAASDYITDLIKRLDRYGQGFPPDKKDLMKLSFEEIDRILDDIETNVKLKGNIGNIAKPTEEEAIYNQNNLLIFKGDSKDNCIKFGNGYTFCIARKDASNLYFSYRMRANNPIFYFVQDNDRMNNLNDIWRYIVIYPAMGDGFMVATADNPGDKQMSWEQIVSHQPKLNGLQHLIQSGPLSPQERKDYEKYKSPRTDEQYSQFSLSEKYKYIQFGHLLSSGQQDLTEKRLLEFYATNQIYNITDNTYKRISNSAKRILIRNGADLTEYQRSITPPELLSDYYISHPLTIFNKEWYHDLPEDKKELYKTNWIKKADFNFWDSAKIFDILFNGKDKLVNEWYLKVIKEHTSIVDVPQNLIPDFYDYHNTLKTMLIRYGVNFEKLLPPYLLTDHKWIEDIIKENINVLKIIPPSYPYYKKLCEICVKKDGNAIKWIDDKFKTKEICNIAFEKTPYALDYIPDKYKTEKMCITAITHNPYFIDIIPLQFQTFNLFKQCIENKYFGDVLIPKMNEMKAFERFPQLVRMGLENIPENGRFYPSELFTPELAQLVIDKKAPLNNIPMKFRTYELSKQSILQNGKNIKFVSKKIVNKHPDLLLLAVKEYGIILSKIPNELKTREVCKQALESSSDRIKTLLSVPNNLLDRDIFESLFSWLIKHPKWNTDRATASFVNGIIKKDPRVLNNLDFWKVVKIHLPRLVRAVPKEIKQQLK